MAGPLPRSFYERDVVTVARDLLGRRLVHRIGRLLTAGRIVEVEAYLGLQDPASHAYCGPTRRNATLFGPAGRAYVYLIHNRVCMDVTAAGPHQPHAVLLRALEPLQGAEHMRARRGRVPTRDLARGPGRLCQAMGIGRNLDGWDLTLGRRLWIDDESPPADPSVIGISTRLGLSKAADRPLRFFLIDSPFVSGPRRKARALAPAQPARDGLTLP